MRRFVRQLTLFSSSAFLVVFTSLTASASAGDRPDAGPGALNTQQGYLNAAVPTLQASSAGSLKRRSRSDARVFSPEKGLRGEHNFIFVLEDEPLASYRGGVRGLAATSPAAGSRARASSGLRTSLDARSDASLAYRAYLAGKQRAFRERAESVLGRAIVEKRRTGAALNASVLRMMQDEAVRVARVRGVRLVERDLPMQLDTDSGPTFIGAAGLWDGSATGGLAAQGEGIVVGIIDSGINGDHPSFGDVGDDGYDHTNPLGSGSYLGDCFATPELVCNDKLIGRYNFTANNDTPADDSEDTDGHGTHVASTAAGNVLFDVPIIDADSNPGGFSIGTISGVAPHANLIAYKVCNPSCFSSDVIAAIDQALLDGVDVLNKSISSPPGSPWASSLSLAHLNARAGGISFAISAGNDGPDFGTVSEVNGAPWNGAVAASSHDRAFPEKLLKDISGGDTSPPAAITGRGLTGGYTGPVVYAGNYSNGDPDPEQCLNPFPANTWTGGEIVVCDRGAIARVAKCQNVRDGGAAGCILANIDDGATSVADDPHVIPAIHIDNVAGNALKAWLASGSGHTATIEAGGAPFADPAAGDIMADFSSRGPYFDFDFLAPNVSGPGLSIYAAFVGPQEYAFLQGTSMSSPHVAGAMALLRQAQPAWTDAEILSALMSTGQTDMLKDDGVTPADPFDYGGGRVQLIEAVNAGLLLDQSVAGFEAADPELGGDPAQLNVAAMAQDACLSSCSFTRTVTATVADTWTASSSGEFGVTIDPAVFALGAGETQTLTITADVAGLPAGQWLFGETLLTPAGASPATAMQMAIQPSNGDLPLAVTINASRDAGSVLVEDLASVAIEDLQIEAFGLTAGEAQVLEITGETGDFDPYNQPDGVGVALFEVPLGASRFVVRTTDSEAPDADLFVGRDDNGDGMISIDEERCNAGTGGSEESCELSNPQGGTYWAAVINFTASAPDATDATTVIGAAVVPGTGNFSAAGPAGPVGELEAFDIRLFWDLDDGKEGDVFYGDVRLGSSSASPGNIGTIPVTLLREADDVSFSVDSEVAEVADALTFTVQVQPNLTAEELNYQVDAVIPAGFSYVDGSLSVNAGEASSDGSSVSWTLAQPSLLGAEPLYQVLTNVEEPGCVMPEFGQGGGYIDLEAFGLGPVPDAAGDTFSLSAFEAQNLNFYGSSRDALNFTDDGFAFFGSTPGPNPWVNTPIPFADDPNDLAAIFWRDFDIVVDDGTGGSIRGVTLATAGPDISIIEYDDVEPWPAGASDDRIDFEMLIWGFQDDTPGAWEIVMAYDNVSGYEDGVGTIGVENPSGTSGTQFAFNDTVISDGLVVCYDLSTPDFEPATLIYQVRVEFEAMGSDIVSEVTSTVDNPGSGAVTETLAVFVNEPQDVDEDGWFDFEDNCIEVSNVSQCDSDLDGSGNHCDADFNDSGFVNFSDLAELKVGFFGISTAPEYNELDLNCDESVDFGDLMLFKGMFGTSPGPSAGN